MRLLLAAVLLALLALASPAAAQTFPEHGGAPVVDQADLLTPGQEAELAAKAQALHSRTGRALVVVTVSSLEGLTVEDYAGRLLRHWKVGDEARDDGVILLVAPEERKVRIETGYGAEAFLPDILAGRIIRDDILPRFRSGDMAGGIIAGASAIEAQLQLSPEEARQRASEAAAGAQEAKDSPASVLPIVFWVMVVAFVLLSLGRRSSGRRYRSRRGGGGIDPWIVLWGLSELSRASRGHRGWGGGGGFGGGGFGGGGFGGFGGGSGGGGGASGSW